MKVLIIEDELPAFKRLKKLILEISASIEVVAHLDGIQAAKNWFAINELPDIVFLDIHIADGTAFDLQKEIKIDCPIIYTTAFDQYAMDAFKTSGIDYLLKPIKKEDLQHAFLKLQLFKTIFHHTDTSDASTAKEYKKRFVIRFGEHIKTLNIEDIAYFYSENKATFARSFEGRNFPVDNNLDALAQMIDPHLFFRINRQYLISLASIAEMRTYSKARVIISLQPDCKEQPVVSSERAALFKQWLAGE